MAALDEMESVLFRERWPNLELCGDADRFPVSEDVILGLPVGLSLPRPERPLKVLFPSPDSLALGLWRRVPSMSIPFMRLLWLESELIVLLARLGTEGPLVWEYLRPPNPGPGAFIGVLYR